MDNETAIERPSTFEDGQDIRDRAFQFACRVVKFCQGVYDRGGVGRMMVPQIVDCATSFATMLEEAKAAESRPDFISKCSISLKESRESWTRLRVCRPAASDLIRRPVTSFKKPRAHLDHDNDTPQ